MTRSQKHALSFIALPAPGRAVSVVLRGLARRIELRRSRARLARLDAHLLRDIGLDSSAAEAEAKRPFWLI